MSGSLESLYLFSLPLMASKELMEIILLSIITVLSIILFKMLQSKGAVFPFYKIVYSAYSEKKWKIIEEKADKGYITVYSGKVIFEGNKYLIKKKEKAGRAKLNIQDENLSSIVLFTEGGSAEFFIDPEFGRLPNPAKRPSEPHLQHPRILAF